jgi:hypothetical protein
MDNQSLIIVLFAFTLLAAVAIGVWQLVKVRRAKELGHHSAMTERNRQR